jgi:hypothetical protein
MAERIRVAVVGLADGPEAEAGAGVLACLDPRRHERVGILGDRNESGAARPGLCDRVLLLPPIEDAEFVPALADAIRREELEVVLPGSARAAAVLAEGRKVLRRAGVDPGPLNRRALGSCVGARLVATARKAAIAAARRETVPPEDLAAALEKQESWPLLAIGERGGRRLATDWWEAWRAYQALAAEGETVTLCDWNPEQAFEVALVQGENAEPIAAAAVRVLAGDERARPWLAVTIQNRPLVDAALCFARVAGLAGPLRFLFQRRDQTFELVDARAGFPLWVEVVHAGGPNLVELAVALARGETPEGRRDAPATPAGVLFSQTAEDHVVDPLSIVNHA